MSVYKVQMLFVAIFAICGTVFNIVGPKILGKATTEIFNGLVSKVSGGSGMDFGKIGQILLHDLGAVYDQRSVFLYPGNYYDGSFPENNIPFAKGNFGKDQSDADELF